MENEEPPEPRDTQNVRGFQGFRVAAVEFEGSSATPCGSCMYASTILLHGYLRPFLSGTGFGRHASALALNGPHCPPGARQLGRDFLFFRPGPAPAEPLQELGEPLDPMQVGPLRLIGVVADTDRLTDLGLAELRRLFRASKTGRSRSPTSYERTPSAARPAQAPPLIGFARFSCAVCRPSA